MISSLLSEIPDGELRKKIESHIRELEREIRDLELELSASNVQRKRGKKRFDDENY
jgi:ferritin-like metal-binding protein YciE